MENELFRYHYGNLEKYLRSNSFRKSGSRKELLRFICSGKFCLNSHFTADDLMRYAEENSVSLPRASVFRNLSLFSDIGILRKSKFGENHFHYELNRKTSISHHHLICKKCEKVIEFRDTSVKELTENIARLNKFKVTDHRFEIFGYCEECARKANVSD